MDRGHHGRVDEAAVGQREEVEAVVDDVELAGAFESSGDVRALGDLGVESRRPRTSRAGTTDAKRAAVTELAVANRVTSWPRATRPSVSSDANSSHGP